MEIINNVSQTTLNEDKVVFSGRIGKVGATNVTILQKDIPINQIRKIDVINKRSGMSIFGGVVLLFLTQLIIKLVVSQFNLPIGYRAPDASISPMQMFLLAANAISSIIGLYLIVHGIVGTKYLKIFCSTYSIYGDIEVKCNSKKERKLFIDAVNSVQQDTKTKGKTTD